MQVSQLLSALIGACFGSLGWLFVGLYLNGRAARIAARNAARAVFFELELNRANVAVARSYGELVPLSRGAYEQLLPQLANLLTASDLSLVAAAYMAHVGYEQIRRGQELPRDARDAALGGILKAQEEAIARLKIAAFTSTERADLPITATG